MTQLTDLPKTSRPAETALNLIGITKLEQLADHTEADIQKLHGMGPKAIRILKEALAERDLSFKK